MTLGLGKIGTAGSFQKGTAGTGARMQTRGRIATPWLLCLCVLSAVFSYGCALGQATDASTMRVTTESLPNGAVQSGYSSGLTASGGVAPYSWKAVGGTLPPGLQISSSTGMITGMPSTTGRYIFTVEATDSSTKPKTALRGLSITIGADALPLSISSSGLPNGELRVSYTSPVNVSGGTAPYTWSVSSGSLPAGLSLNSSNGTISGTPTTSGAFPFSLSVKDSSANPQSASQSLAITVETMVQVTTSSLPSGTAKSEYSAALGAQGGLAPYSWRVNSGSLPAGLTLSQGGAISGMPAQTGNTSFSVAVTDSSSTPQTMTQSLSVNVQTTNSAPAPSPLSISTSGVVNGISSQSYSGSVSASGGTSPYTYAVTAGSLPAGLSLNGSTGTISGNPATSGTFPFTVQVKDSSASQQTASASASVLVVAPLQITTTSMPAMQVQSSVNAAININGGMAPYTYGVSSGSLPAGLSLSSSTGVISGTPTAAGEYHFTVQVTDPPSLPQSASQTFAGNVATNGTPSSLQITTTSLTGGQLQTSYSATLAATGGTQPYTWSISSGSLNAGLTLSAGGQILGTPTGSGSSSFTVKVTDANSNTATQALSIGVAGSVTITTTSLPGATQGVTYSTAVAASGGSAPYSWSISSGSLPAGISLNSNGTISGSASATGTFAIGVQVADSNNNVATQNFNLVVSAPVAGTPAQFAGLKVCQRQNPIDPETDSGDCNAYASPADPEPNVYGGNSANVYTDSVFGTKIKRLTPQPGMPVGAYAPKYAPYQSWSKNGTYLVLSGPGGGAYLLQGTDPYTYIRQVTLPPFDGVDEYYYQWSNTNDCLLIIVNSNKIQTINVCQSDALTTLASFTTLTDTQGNALNLAANGLVIKPYIYCGVSNDDTKIGSKIVDGNGVVYGFGVFTLNLSNNTGGYAWVHKIYAPGDLVENEAPADKLPAGACISANGNYVDVDWNTYGAGRATTVAAATRLNNVVTVVGTTPWPSGITVGAPINLDGVTSDPSFNGKFVVSSIPSSTTLTYSQSGADSAVTTATDPNTELDYTYYGTQTFSASTGALIAQISNAESHMDEMLLADGTEAVGGGFVAQVHDDYRRFEAYQNSTGTFFNAYEPDSAYGSQWHFSGRGSTSPGGLPGYALVSTYSQSQQVDCAPQIVFCAEIMAVKMDGSNTFYRIAHSQSIQDDSSGNEQYYDEPHATPNRTFTKVIFASDWRTFSNTMDVFLVEIQ
jgi:hypothetical protein